MVSAMQLPTTNAPGSNGTPTTQEQALFGDDLICPTVAQALPEGYRVRGMRRSDYHAGFLDCLRVLTTVGEISEEQFSQRYDWLSRQDGGYYILVIEDTNGGKSKVVGTGALIVERKLYVSLCVSRCLT